MKGAGRQPGASVVAVPVHHPDASALLAAYFDELRVRFGGFEPPSAEAISADAERGVVLVAYDDATPVACGSLRLLDDGTAEVKRMFVVPAARRRGHARRMLATLEESARARGCRRIVLDTHAVLDEAQRLYRTEGYLPIPRFNDNPYAAHWFGKELPSPAAQRFYGEDLAYVHAEAYAAVASAAAAEWVPRLRDAGVRRVLDVGCGAGVTTAALSEAGFDVLGIDPSPSLLAIAQRTAPRARFARGSAYEISLEPCEAIFAIGEVLGYHTPDVDAEARVRTFFRRASHALGRGGHLVFDLIEAEGPSLVTRGWSSGDDWAVLVATDEDRPARRLVRTIETFRRTSEGTYRRTGEVHHVCVFSRTEVTRWLEAEGFDVASATAYGSYTLATRRVAFAATRR